MLKSRDLIINLISIVEKLHEVTYVATRYLSANSQNNALCSMHKSTFCLLSMLSLIVFIALLTDAIQEVVWNHRPTNGDMMSNYTVR